MTYRQTGSNTKRIRDEIIVYFSRVILVLLKTRYWLLIISNGWSAYERKQSPIS